MMLSSSRSFRLMRFLSGTLAIFICCEAIPTFAASDDPKQRAKDAVSSAIGTTVGVNAPIRLNVEDTKECPQVAAPSGFTPQHLEVSSDEDLVKPLPPGDYSVTLTAYCTNYSIHVPGRGTGYALAPLKGREAGILSKIIVQGTVNGVPHDTLQEVNWRVQSGLSIDDWPEEEKNTVNNIVSGKESDELRGDYVERTKKTYNSFRPNKLANAAISIFTKNKNQNQQSSLPEFEELLNELGDPGRELKRIIAARQVLKDKTVAAERRPDLLYQATAQPDGLPRILPNKPIPDDAPWSQIRSGVIARITIGDGRMGNNLLEFRVTPQAQEAKKVALASRNIASVAAADGALADGLITLAEVIGGTAFLPEELLGGLVIGGGLLIGYGVGRGTQALILWMGHGENSGNNSNGEAKFPDNPDKNPEKYRPIRGSSAKENTSDGSVWDEDNTGHGGPQWKRWPNRKAWENGGGRRGSTSVWPDGRVRKW